MTDMEPMNWLRPYLLVLPLDKLQDQSVAGGRALSGVEGKEVPQQHVQPGAEIERPAALRLAPVQQAAVQGQELLPETMPSRPRSAKAARFRSSCPRLYKSIRLLNAVPRGFGSRLSFRLC